MIRCLTLTAGPPGIQTQRDVDGVVVPLLGLAALLNHDAAAFVVACFSDPGLQALREMTGKPVFGISESAALTAMTLGQTFGASRSWKARSRAIFEHGARWASATVWPERSQSD